MWQLVQVASQTNFQAEYVHISKQTSHKPYLDESPETCFESITLTRQVLFLCQRRLTDLDIMKIGDTPTIGAGFWAEEWNSSSYEKTMRYPQDVSPRISTALSGFVDGLCNIMGDCIPNFSAYQELPSTQVLRLEKVESTSTIRAVAVSGLSLRCP